MKSWMRAGIVMVAVAGLAACATRQERVEAEENNLSAAGFTVRPANTPKRVSMLRTLPPNKFIRTVKGNNVGYVYADPLVCGCLYTGDQAAYGRYQQALQAKRLADEQAFAAQTYQDASWDWGPWGGFGPYGPGF